MTSIPKPVPAKARQHTALIVVILLGIVGVAWQVGRMLPSGPNTEGAYLACRAAVREKLTAPDTARFEPYAADNVSPLTATPDHLRVHGVVTAQNRFGVPIRQAFTCTVTHLSGDTWRLLELDLEP